MACNSQLTDSELARLHFRISRYFCIVFAVVVAVVVAVSVLLWIHVKQRSTKFEKIVFNPWKAINSCYFTSFFHPQLLTFWIFGVFFTLNVWRHIFDGSYLCSLSLFCSDLLPRKYSAVSSLALDYIILLYTVNELPLCSQCLFVTICSQWCFQKKTKSLFKMIMKKNGSVGTKFGMTVHRKTGLTHPWKVFWGVLKIVAPWMEKKVLIDIGQ